MNKRTINPDAMYLHIALRSGHDEADRVCPLVPDASAKPPVADCDPYCMAGSTPCRKCRERAAANAQIAKADAAAARPRISKAAICNAWTDTFGGIYALLEKCGVEVTP